MKYSAWLSLLSKIMLKAMAPPLDDKVLPEGAPKVGPARPRAEDLLEPEIGGAVTPQIAASSRAGSGAAAVLRAGLPPLLLAGGLGVAHFWRLRFQRSQTFLPEQYPNGLWQPAPYGVNAEDVWTESEDGTRLHGWWMPVRRARGTVLYCHGNSGNITSRIGVYRALARMRFNALAVDYRGYGRSEGRPSEAGVLADARAAYDLLVNQIGQPAEQVILFGHSLGGAVAIDLALHRPAAGLIVQSSFTDLKEMARSRFRRLPLHLIARNEFRSVSKVDRLMLPKLFVHGTADETVPLALGQQLFARAAAPKEWYVVPDAGHNDVLQFGGARYLWKLSHFSRRCVREAHRRPQSSLRV